jgi:hypothetical protein
MAGVIAISIEKYATSLLCPGYSQEEYGGRLVKSVCSVISGYSRIMLFLPRSGYWRSLDRILFAVHAAPKACRIRWSPGLK